MQSLEQLYADLTATTEAQTKLLTEYADSLKANMTPQGRIELAEHMVLTLSPNAFGKYPVSREALNRAIAELDSLVAAHTASRITGTGFYSKGSNDGTAENDARERNLSLMQ